MGTYDAMRFQNTIAVASCLFLKKFFFFFFRISVANISATVLEIQPRTPEKEPREPRTPREGIRRLREQTERVVQVRQVEYVDSKNTPVRQKTFTGQKKPMCRYLCLLELINIFVLYK